MSAMINCVMLSFLFFFCIYTGAWLMNDAAAGFNTKAGLCDAGIKSEVKVGTGFWWLDGVKAFHVGLWPVIFGAASMFIMVMSMGFLYGESKSKRA